MARLKLTDLKVAKTRKPSTAQKQIELWDTEVPGFGLRIGHKGRRAFMMMVRVHGRQRRFTLGAYPEMSLKEAREAARNVRADAQRGTDPKEREAQERRVAERERLNTFKAVAAEFIEDHAKKAAPKSWRELQRKIDKDLLPDWGDRPIGTITRHRRVKTRQPRLSQAPSDSLLASNP